MVTQLKNIVYISNMFKYFVHLHILSEFIHFFEILNVSFVERFDDTQFATIQPATEEGFFDCLKFLN